VAPRLAEIATTPAKTSVQLKERNIRFGWTAIACDPDRDEVLLLSLLREDEIGCRPVAELTPLTTWTPITTDWDGLGMNVPLYLFFAKQRYDSTQFDCFNKPFDLKTFERYLCKLSLLLAEKALG
jgi:hypothetical protein